MQNQNPIHSMTGFGKAENHFEGVQFTLELKSVNHRYCEIRPRLPKELGDHDLTIREKVQKRVSRGRVDISIRFGTSDQELPMTPVLDLSKAKQYAQLFEQLNTELSAQSGPPPAELLFQLPGVITYQTNPEKIEVLGTLLMDTLEQALIPFLEMRSQEGENLRKDLFKRLETLNNSLAQILLKAPEQARLQFEKLLDRLAKFSLPESIDEPRLHQEVAIWSDRYDISEEITRAQSHISQFDKLLKEGGSVGRRLDFLCQELNREANTIGSKSQDAEIANHMIELKSEIEKIREQVQNIE